MDLKVQTAAFSILSLAVFCTVYGRVDHPGEHRE